MNSQKFLLFKMEKNKPIETFAMSGPAFKVGSSSGVTITIVSSDCEETLAEVG